MWCYYGAVAKEIEGGVTEDTFTIWRSRNPDIFPHTNFTTLATQRLFIVKEGKLPGFELDQIQADVCGMNGITTAPFEQNPKPFQQIDDYQQPAS